MQTCTCASASWLLVAQAMRDIVAKCLMKDPSRRPTAAQLLDHKFFKVGMPALSVILGDRNRKPSEGPQQTAHGGAAAGSQLVKLGMPALAIQRFLGTDTDRDGKPSPTNVDHGWAKIRCWPYAIP